MKSETITEFQIRIERAPTSRISEVDFNNIPFGSNFSDHMFVMDYANGSWTDARIIPYKAFELQPSCSGLHYGQLIFEGMKAFKDQNGHGVMFRPDRNIRRMNLSARRMAMPEVPEELFAEALQRLLEIDLAWIPNTSGSSLYLRPFMFANENFIGVKPAERFRFAIITSPAGLYYPKPVRILAAQRYVRAFPGGTGFAKAAGNYGATMQPLREARAKGYDQLLWLDGVDFKYVQEIGTMNVFFRIGETVLTPSTEDGCILEGVTRESVIELLRDKGVAVEVRPVSIHEIIDGLEGGKEVEIWGTGTAATIAQIIELGYKDKTYSLPEAHWTLSSWLKKELEDLRTGRIPDRFGWNVRIGVH